MKKILGPILTVALVLSLMIIPGVALAANTTGVTGEVAATANVTSITPDNGDPGETLTGVLIGGTNFQAGAAVSFNASIAIPSYHVDSATQITANITIDGGAAAGPRDVIVTQGGKINTGGTGLFTVNEFYINVTAPSAIDLGVMTADTTTYGFSTDNGSVDTNYPTWSVTAEDSTNGGYMRSGGAPLTHKFQISSDNATFADADSGIPYESNPTSLPFHVKQTVEQGDTGGSYTITITFTGSP